MSDSTTPNTTMSLDMMLHRAWHTFVECIKDATAAEPDPDLDRRYQQAYSFIERARVPFDAFRDAWADDEALAADDAARGTMREQFEAWHRAEFPSDPIYRSEEYGYHRVSVAERWRGWQASRAAAPQAGHVGDTRFEGWLSVYTPDSDGGRALSYSKQDMRNAYAAGHGEAAAPQSVEPAYAPPGYINALAQKISSIEKLPAPDLSTDPDFDAPTDAEWQEEAMRLAREWCLSWGEWAHDNDPDCAKENAAEAALRAHIATRPLPAPPTKKEQP